MSTPTQPNSDSDQASKGLIMVVESEKHMREAIVDVLELDHYVVLGFETSQQALAVLRAYHHRPDLILLAVSMPTISSLELVNEVRKEPIALRVPFILLVDRNGLTNEDRGKVQSVADCLFKPFDAEDLLIVADVMLRRKQRND